MNLDIFIGRLRSHVFHDDQWPADSSTVTCDIDRFVVDLAGTPQLAELSNKSGRSMPTMRSVSRSPYPWTSQCLVESSSWITEHCSHRQHLVE